MRRVAMLALLACLCLAPSASAARLKADYRFNDTRVSSVSGAPSLTDVDSDPESGPGHDNVFATETVKGASRRVLTFPQGNGLQVSTAGLIPASSYAIVVLFRFSDTTGFRRIVDFKDNMSDTGLYNQDGRLVFYNVAGGSDAVITPSGANDPYHEVVLTRDSSGLVIGSVDGVEQFRFTDDGGLGVIHSGQTLKFFKDDIEASGEEAAGAVANIRLYDGPDFTPPPVLGRKVNVSVVSGTVKVAAPGSSHFVPVTKDTQIPVGSTLNTKHGTVALTSAVNTAGKSQTGKFRGGLFQVRQARRRGAFTELRLKGGNFGSCTLKVRGKRARSSRRRRSRRTVRRLFGSGKGSFRTRGKYSAATVRGTKWTMQDRCDGTLTKVTSGRVSVRDFRRHRTVVVRAGHSYLAKVG